jgi:hypothetical protein
VRIRRSGAVATYTNATNWQPIEMASVTPEPTAEIDCPTQSFRNSAFNARTLLRPRMRSAHVGVQKDQ